MFFDLYVLPELPELIAPSLRYAKRLAISLISMVYLDSLGRYFDN
jgi:hypothetical protein